MVADPSADVMIDKGRRIGSIRRQGRRSTPQRPIISSRRAPEFFRVGFRICRFFIEKWHSRVSRALAKTTRHQGACRKGASGRRGGLVICTLVQHMKFQLPFSFLEADVVY